MAQMRAEGVDFRTNIHVGKDISAEQLRNDYQAVVLTGGAEHTEILLCQDVN